MFVLPPAPEVGYKSQKSEMVDYLSCLFQYTEIVAIQPKTILTREIHCSLVITPLDIALIQL